MTQPENENDRETGPGPIGPAVQSTLRSILARAQLTTQDTEKLLKLADEIKDIHGRVVEVWSSKDVEYKTIKSPTGETIVFSFPPNDEKFDQELKRVQSSPHLRVRVTYSYERTASHVLLPIIYSVEVYEPQWW
jgi:hypothetical protein